MKAGLFALLFLFAYVECRKIVPIAKNANVDFINMEGGLAPKSGTTKPGIQAPAKPAQAPGPTTAATKPTPVVPNVGPAKPAVQPTPVKPVVQPTPAKSPVQPTPAKPGPAYPVPAANPNTTPGPGSVKQLVTFYDSQGKASVIRPYSYSQAVKQG